MEFFIALSGCFLSDSDIYRLPILPRYILILIRYLGPLLLAKLMKIIITSYRDAYTVLRLQKPYIYPEYLSVLQNRTRCLDAHVKHKL